MKILFAFDTNFLMLLISGVVLILTIILLNMVISPLMQARYLNNELTKKSDVEGAFKDVPTSSPWFNNVAEMKKAQKENEKIGYERVSIKSNDDLSLAGYLFEQPKTDKVKGTFILMHSYHSYSLREFACLTNDLYKQGFNVLVVDSRCHLKSEGQYITFGVREHEDLLNWIKYIDERFNKSNIYLLGSDLGAITISMVANKVSEYNVKGLVLESPFVDGRSLFSKFIFATNKVRNVPQTLKFSNSMLKRKCHFSLDDINPLECMKNSEIPCVFIVGTADQYGTRDCDTVYQNSTASYKKMLMVNGATHGECYYRGKAQYLEEIKDLVKAGK